MRKAVTLPDGIIPNLLYRPSIFVWLPHLLDSRPLTCQNPECRNKNNKKYPLACKGWNNNPVARRVVSLDRVYYVMTQRFYCQSSKGGCGKSVNLYDPSILQQLDMGLASEFPAFLTHRSGIDKTLMTLVHAGMAHRVSSNAWSQILRELHDFTLPDVLFTAVNEFEQICIQLLLSTRALVNIKGSLMAMVRSIDDHGLCQPVIGFSDNVASDSATFMQCIPSLAEGV
ncbi:hypothetical protein JAAARDRAFT_699398, partial [Jaapia argillacea MUCL 33604]